MDAYEQHPPSPCINDCAIDYDSGWCRACFRTLQEIARWPSMTASQKSQLLVAIQARRGGAK